MKNKVDRPETYTREFFVNSGRKGGNKTKERHGTEHFQRMVTARMLKRSKQNET